MDLEEIGINAGNLVDSAQDRDYWRVLANAVLNLRVPLAMELDKFKVVNSPRSHSISQFMHTRMLRSSLPSSSMWTPLRNSYQIPFLHSFFARDRISSTIYILFAEEIRLKNKQNQSTSGNSFYTQFLRMGRRRFNKRSICIH